MSDFTVIIPCRNGAATLPAALDSLKAQSFGDWRAIVIDDGSSDATPHILAAEDDPRIASIRAEGVGPALARNLGAAEARSPWLAFLDADDLWPADRLSALTAAIHLDPEADAFYGRCAIFTEDPAQPGAVTRVKDQPLAAEHVLGDNPVCTMSNFIVSAAVWRACGGLDPAMVHAEDLHLLIRLVAGGARIIGVNRVLTWYRTSPWGLSADLTAMEDGWRACLAQADALGLVSSAGAAGRAEARQLRYLARRALRLGAPGRVAADFALRGAAASPRAFFADPLRGGALFLAALAAPMTPARLSRALYSD